MLLKRSLVVFALLLSTSAFANNFRAADVVFLPTAGRVSNFNTDVYLSNPGNERVAVSVAFAPTDTPNNSTAVTNAVSIGAVLQPGERREIIDPLGTWFNRQGLGQLIFFGCREGAPNCDCGVSPGDCRPISVEARIYATLTAPNCPNGAATCTTGQLFAGIPWYAYASRTSVTGYDRVFVTGIRNFGQRSNPASGFRSNIGLINGSQFSSTDLTVTLFSSTNQQIGTPATVNLGPLGHTQRNLSALFPSATDIRQAAFIVVEQTNVTPTSDAAAAGCTNGCPAFFAYGSALDNSTDDPTTLEGQFPASLTESQLNCIFAAKPPERPVRRR